MNEHEDIEVFLDMDGVLVNLIGGIMQIHGAPEDYKGAKSWEHVSGWNGTSDTLSRILGRTILEVEVWNNVAEHGNEFWASLEPLDDYEDIIEFSCAVTGKPGFEDIYLCSTPTPIGGCASGKLSWMKKHLPQEMWRNYVLTPHKGLVAAPGRVLIDDNDANIREWRNMGGIGILMPMPWNSGKTRPSNLREYLVDEFQKQA